MDNISCEGVITIAIVATALLTQPADSESPGVSVRTLASRTKSVVCDIAIKVNTYLQNPSTLSVNGPNLLSLTKPNDASYF